MVRESMSANLIGMNPINIIVPYFLFERPFGYFLVLFEITLELFVVTTKRS